MSDDPVESSEQKSGTQAPNAPTTGNVVSFPDFDFDVAVLDAFLDVVFGHITREPGEHILTFSSRSNIPGLPTNDEELLAKLARSKRPQALYYGIATCAADPRTQQLRNRKALFKQLCVIVLDDIGTKVD